MLLQNLHHRYLYIVIQLPHVNDLHQKIPSFPHCEDYGIHRASNPNPLQDDTWTIDNELHQQICQTFHIDYLQEMDIILKIKARIERKINETLLALLQNRGPVTSTGENTKNPIKSSTSVSYSTGHHSYKLIKGINAIVDAKRAGSFNNAIKMLNANVEITHNRLVTLENRTSMMAKAIMPALKDLKMKINNTNQQLTSLYRMMSSAHNRYNLLFRQTHETRMIHHLALLLLKNYIYYI